MGSVEGPSTLKLHEQPVYSQRCVNVDIFHGQNSRCDELDHKLYESPQPSDPHLSQPDRRRAADLPDYAGSCLHTKPFGQNIVK